MRTLLRRILLVSLLRVSEQETDGVRHEYGQDVSLPPPEALQALVVNQTILGRSSIDKQHKRGDDQR